MSKIYKSKKDRWLVIVSWFAIAVILISIFFLLMSTGFTKYNIIYTASMLLLVVFVFYCLNSTSYLLKDDELVVSCFFFKWKIPLSSIKEIFPTNNPLSSPALSLDRLNIVYGNEKHIMISPEDKTVFLQDIVSKNPNLKLDGNKVTI